METTDTTRPFVLTPEGKREFTVKEMPLKKATASGDKFYYVFKFSYIEEDGGRRTHTEYLMPWDLKPLLLAFGFPEKDKNKFEWERQDTIGKTVQATIVHESMKKDPTKLMARMRDILPAVAKKQDDIPF